MDLTYLVGQIKGDTNIPNLRLRQGRVVALNVSPNSVDVQIAGDTNTLPRVRYLASYTPTSSDTIWLLSNGSDLLVIGKQA
jgi:hypothetical protein